VTFGWIDALSTTLQDRNRVVEARSASANALNRVSVPVGSLSLFSLTGLAVFVRFLMRLGCPADGEASLAER